MVVVTMATACNTPPSQNVQGTDTFNVPECVVTAVPDSLGLDSFYVKYVDVNGLPLISSW